MRSGDQALSNCLAIPLAPGLHLQRHILNTSVHVLLALLLGLLLHLCVYTTKPVCMFLGLYIVMPQNSTNGDVNLVVLLLQAL